jgi:hypothetical protein
MSWLCSETVSAMLMMSSVTAAIEAASGTGSRPVPAAACPVATHTVAYMPV